MGYAAIALATLGLGLGLTSRVWALLPIVMLLFLATVGFAFHQEFSLGETTLVAILSQVIIQFCYFLGLVVRTTFGPPRQPVARLATKHVIRTFGDVRATRLGRRAA